MAIIAALSIACSNPQGDAVEVIIPLGSSFRAATDSLVSAGVISRAGLFRLFARIQGKDTRLQPGVYLLRPGTSWNTVIATVSDASNSISRVTIPEGFAISQIIPLLAGHLNLPDSAIASAVRDSALREKLNVPTETLEGYLFPDTYIFPPGTSAAGAVREMVNRFESNWRSAYDTRLAQLDMTRHELISLASIVEKEARIAEERPVIAAVYYNRLKIGMPLQADPTVQYARGFHTDRVLYKDLKIESLYNTYLYPGIPPGPIASPGASSIEATLNPAQVPFLYFVARPDGHHQFTRTLAEHNAAIRAIRGPNR